MNRSVHPLLPVYLMLLLWNISWSISVNGPVMPLYIRSLGIEVLGWSVLVMSCAGGMFLFEWVWGMLSDRVNRRAIMAVAMLCMSIIFPLYSVPRFLPYFVVFQFLSGALAVTIGPATSAIVSDDAPPDLRGFSMSVWWAFHTLGRLIGPMVGSYLAQVQSFEHSFYLSSILSAIGAACILMTYKSNDKKSYVNREPALGIAKSFRALMSIPSVPLLHLEVILAYLGLSLVRSFLPIYASEEVGMSKVEVGLLVSIASIAMLLATPVLGWLADRIGKRIIVCTGFVFSSLVFLCYLFAQTGSQLVLVSVGISVCFSASCMLLAMLSDVAPSTLRGTSMGIYGTFEDLGLIAGSMLFGFVWSTMSPSSIFVAAFATQIVGAMSLLLLRPRLKK